MKELARSNWNYILYEDDENLLLSVVCGSIGLFDRNISLNAVEKKSYLKEGIIYIEKLAVLIRKDPKKYEFRHIILKSDK